MNFGKLSSNVVTDAIVCDDASFAASLGFTHELTGAAGIGWTWNGTNFDAPVRPPPTKAELYDYACAVRERAEHGGMLFNGHPLPTDAKGQAYISGAHQKAMKTPTTVKRWQVAKQPITFVTFTNQQLRDLGDALDTLVQSTFNLLDTTVGPAITAGTITTYAQIDTAFAGLNRVFVSP